MNMRFGSIAVALLFASAIGLQVPPAVAQAQMKEVPPDSQDPDPIGVISQKALSTAEMKEVPPDNQDPDPIGAILQNVLSTAGTMPRATRDPSVLGGISEIDNEMLGQLLLGGLGAGLPTAAQGAIAPNNIQAPSSILGAANSVRAIAPNSIQAPSSIIGGAALFQGAISKGGVGSVGDCGYSCQRYGPQEGREALEAARPKGGPSPPWKR